MFVRCLWLLQSANSTSSRGRPNVAKLLYGKRINATHQSSQARLSVPALLSRTSTDKLEVTVRHVMRMNDVTCADVTTVLKSCRAFRRMDRAELVVRALAGCGYHLTGEQYALLMAHANDAGDRVAAMRYWQAAVRAGKVTASVHGALLASYRHTGAWQAAIRHCNAMWEDKHMVDCHAVHAVMNACRLCGACQEGIDFFHTAVNNGTRPNAVVYLELLRLLAQTKTTPRRWEQSLAVLEAIRDTVDLTAGHYNAVLDSLAGSSAWTRGVELFRAMKERGVQPSGATLTALLRLRPHSLTHCVRCVAEAHTLGMPVTDFMYRALLTNLFRHGLDHEAIQFIERELRRDLDDTGHTASCAMSLGVALLDSLLAHPSPHDALLMYEAFETKLAAVVAGASGGLGEAGALSQRWLVQGRVAVVDHNVLLSPRLESLSAHYDSIFIPFSSVRLLTRRLGSQHTNTRRGLHTQRTLDYLRQVLPRESWAMFRVLPLAHQLLAHTYLCHSAMTSLSLRRLRAEAAETPPPVSAAQRFLERLSSPSTTGKGARTAETTMQSNVSVTVASTLMQHSKEVSSFIPIRGVTGDVATSPAAAKQGEEIGVGQRAALDTTAATRRRLAQDDTRITSVERVLSVAVMLKSLNADANVHLVSSSDAQLGLVAQWNALGTPATLSAVRYPDELFDKAPPAPAVGAPCKGNAE